MTTKQAPPSSPHEELVEMEAMDLEEWEKDQHTPQQADDKLAALVKQSAEAPPKPPARNPQTIARTVPKAPPPTPDAPREPIRFGPPPQKPGDPNPFDGPTMVNAGASLTPKRGDAAQTRPAQSTTATLAAGAPVHRHTTSRTATPAGGVPGST